MRKLYLSPSKLGTLRKCEALFVLQYARREPPTGGPSPALVVGRSLDAGAEFDMAAVAATLDRGGPREGADLPLSDVVDVAADAYEDAAEGRGAYTRDDGETVATTEPPVEWDLHEADRSKLKNAALKVIVPAWYAEHAPKVQPASVQTTVRFEHAIPDADMLVVMSTRLDVMPRDGVLVDVKSTGGSNYSTPEQADTDDQLTACDLGFRETTGAAPAALGWDTVRYTHRGPIKSAPTRDEYGIVDTPSTRVPARTDAQIASYLDRMGREAERAQALLDGRVRPLYADRDSWACSKKWCSRWGVCSQGGGSLKV